MSIIYEKDGNVLVCDDNVSYLQTVPNNYIDLFFFSPPYDQARDYIDKPTFDLHALGLEMFRTLKDGGVVVCVIQDQTKNFQKSLTSFRTLIDWVDTCGFKYWETVIYKRKGRPGGWWKTRLRVDHEYIFILFKGSRPKYFQKEHLQVLTSKIYHIPHGGARLNNGGFQKKTKKDSQGMYIDPGTIFTYVNSSMEGIIDKDIKLKHPATFPDKMAEDFIQMFCPEGGLVCDPFGGSGTTGVGALHTGRKFILIDISEEYCKEIALKRIEVHSGISKPTNANLEDLL